MPRASARVPPALKLATYSTAALLPGEDEQAFDGLHKSLVAELAPDGALEEHIVLNLARFVWRRDNLAVLRVAEAANHRIIDLMHQRLHGADEDDAVRTAARAKARTALKQVGELLMVEASEERLTDEIELRAQLDEMIDKCLKRLLFVRGLKSMSRAAAATRLVPGASQAPLQPEDAEAVRAAQ